MYSIFHTRIVRQLLGAIGGMAVASLVYLLINALPSSQVNQAMLIDSSMTSISENAGQVRTNATTVDDATMRRIAERARTVAAQLQASTQSDTVRSSAASQPVDQSAWLQMRATRRALTAVRTASPNSTISVRTSAASGSVLATVKPLQSPDTPAIHPAATTQPTTTPSSLPDSGMGLNIILVGTFFLALFSLSSEKKQALIAACRISH